MSIGPAIRRITDQVSPTANLPRDAELLTRFVATRDEAAFATLAERHGPAVLGVCRRLLGHAQDAEDATQAVFLVLSRRASALRNRESVAAWLHGVAIRVCRKVISHRGRQSGALPTPAPAPPVDEAAAWADVRSVIDDALATLPESLRLPLVLCYLEGLTRDGAATHLGWTVSTFRGRLERGRERLRAELLRRGFPLPASLLAVLLTDSAAPAAAGWAASVARVATGVAPVPDALQSLTHGVVPAMNRWLLATASAAILVGGLVAGLIWAYTADPPRSAPAVPPPRAALLKPDPKAKPTPTNLKGIWTAEIVPPNGDSMRRQTIQFVDGEHAVWIIIQISPGVRSSVTLRGRYEFKESELRFQVIEKYAGDERLSLRPDDSAPRLYEFTWEGKDGAAFRARSKATPDSPWGTAIYKRSNDLPEAPDPLVPESLRTIDRTIKKEPKYSEKPLYLLLAFGAEAKFKVWVVLDGNTLYVDRNGNGDLTDAGEKITPGLIPFTPPEARSPAFLVGDIIDPTGVKHTDVHLSVIRMQTGSVFVKCGLRLAGKTLQVAGPTNLSLKDSPADAQVIPFGSPIVTIRPSPMLQSNPDANGPTDQRFQVGSPGIGAGSFAGYGCEGLPDGIGPVAEFTFTPTNPGEPAKVVTLKLTDRCCGDHFYAKLAVPDGVKTGVNAAKVTLSFPDCPWGNVAPVTHMVDVTPRQKK